MSRFARCAALLVLVLSSTACYHATVETGATPSAVTVRKGFAHGWIYGLQDGLVKDLHMTVSDFSGTQETYRAALEALKAS